MALDLSQCLVIGISSRALFNLEDENDIFNDKGVKAYQNHQRENENKPLTKGTAYHLVEALLKLNELSGKKLVEVIVMSRNSPDTGLRVFKSIEHFGLDITRAAFSGGENLSDYLQAFSVDLFLSKSEEDVQLAIDSGCAAAILYAPPKEIDMSQQIRIAFDADAVIFSEESEHIYKTKGLEAFLKHEKENVNKPLPEGPFAKLLKTLSYLQEQFENSPIRLAIVTARNSPAHERVVQTLRAWKVNIDEAFFLGGLSKDQILKAYRAHIFFDDQETHLEDASKLVPSGKVPYKTGSPLKDLK
ncbi:5'-nucleotidase [Sulfurimonas sp. MAG313]|nr:5'-nucleotidase [Sulfurimonas sp. MAG313]MDF1879926.1 5'-nucleotidase [Sulfurimonas sp. MAG313]